MTRLGKTSCALYEPETGQPLTKRTGTLGMRHRLGGMGGKKRWHSPIPALCKAILSINSLLFLKYQSLNLKTHFLKVLSMCRGFGIWKCSFFSETVVITDNCHSIDIIHWLNQLALWQPGVGGCGAGGRELRRRGHMYENESLNRIWLCNPLDCSPPSFSVHAILQARVLEWVVISLSRGSSGPRNQTWVSCLAGRYFTDWATREVSEGGDICILGADSHCCTAEANTTLRSNYPPIKN